MIAVLYVDANQRSGINRYWGSLAGNIDSKCPLVPMVSVAQCAAPR